MFLIKTLILIQLSSYVASDSALLTSCQGHVAGLKSILSVTIIFLCVGSHPGEGYRRIILITMLSLIHSVMIKCYYVSYYTTVQELSLRSQ